MFNLRLLRGSLCDKMETKYLAQKILREGGQAVKKILVVLGGGRPKGNTARLVQAFIEGAREVGHET